MSLDQLLAELGDDSKSLSHAGLDQLSGLSSEGIVEFKVSWHRLPTPRKYEVLAALADLSEDNLELDFTGVFRSTLSDSDDDVREKATRGLFDCDDRVSIRPLIDLVSKDPSPKVRAAAAESLGKFADLAQGGKVLERDGDRIREALLVVIGQDGQDEGVRRKAIEAVASFNSSEVEDIIRDAYQNGDAPLKQSAIYAMGRSSDSKWLGAVLDETHHADPGMRYEAATAAGQLGDESTVPHLIRLIKDDDFQVQLSAVEALGSIGGSLAKRALLQCLKMGEDVLEDAAQAALDYLELDDDPMGLRFQE